MLASTSTSDGKHEIVWCIFFLLIKLFSYSWAISRKEKNRIIHATTGNTKINEIFPKKKKKKKKKKSNNKTNKKSKFQCNICFRVCGNAGALASHKKSNHAFTPRSSKNQDIRKVFNKINQKNKDKEKKKQNEEEEIEDEAEKIEDEAEKIEDKEEKIEEKAEKIQDEAEKIQDEAEKIEDKEEKIEEKAEKIQDEAEKIQDEAEKIQDKEEKKEEIEEKEMNEKENEFIWGSSDDEKEAVLDSDEEEQMKLRKKFKACEHRELGVYGISVWDELEDVQIDESDESDKEMPSSIKSESDFERPRKKLGFLPLRTKEEKLYKFDRDILKDLKEGTSEYRQAVRVEFDKLKEKHNVMDAKTFSLINELNPRSVQRWLSAESRSLDLYKLNQKELQKKNLDEISNEFDGKADDNFEPNMPPLASDEEDEEISISISPNNILKIPHGIFSADVDKRTPEYREQLRRIYDESRKKYGRKIVTCKSFANANKMKVRTIQRYMNAKSRAEDKQFLKIKKKKSKKKEKEKSGIGGEEVPSKKKHSTTGVKKAPRRNNAAKVAILEDYDEWLLKHPHGSTDDFCKTKQGLSSSTFRNWISKRAREKIKNDAKKYPRSRWSSNDFSARRRPKWPEQEKKLWEKYKAARVNKEKLEAQWFYDNMREIMLKDRPNGWESWDEVKVKENGSWFFGNGKAGGTGGIKGRFAITLRVKTRNKNKTIDERKERLGPYLYYTVYELPKEKYFAGKDFTYPELCYHYGRFPMPLRFSMDESGLNFESKMERGYVDKGEVNVTFKGDRKDMSKRQASMINSYRCVGKNREENIQRSKCFMGEKWSNLSKEEKEAFADPPQPPACIIFKGKPKTFRGSGKVDSAKPADGRLAREQFSFPENLWVFYQENSKMDPNVMHAWTKKFVAWCKNDTIIKVIKREFHLQWIDILVSMDNLSDHCSEEQLRECRTTDRGFKLVINFTPGGCTDVVAVADQELNLWEKNIIVRKYKEHKKKKFGSMAKKTIGRWLK